MARLRLDTRSDWTLPIRHTGAAQTVPVPCYHSYVWLYLVPPGEEQGWRPPKNPRQERLFDAIVDTGSTLTNLPYEVWTEIDGATDSEIRWVERAGDDPIRIGGQAFGFRLGRVLLAASDLQCRQWMPPQWTLARCLEPTENLIPALLGLMSPFLMNGRRVRHEPANTDRPEWWLEDR